MFLSFYCALIFFYYYRCCCCCCQSVKSNVVNLRSLKYFQWSKWILFFNRYILSKFSIFWEEQRERSSRIPKIQEKWRIDRENREDEEENDLFYYQKKKKNLDRVNFHPIQLNLPKKKGDKTRNYVTKQREMTTYIASPYILTICVQNPWIYAL